MAPSPWVQKLDLLKSIDLELVAREINARRQREQPAGRRLPRDRRANARRMRQCLLAIHQLCGANRSWVVTAERIAAEMGVSQKTARRAIWDLEHAVASLVEVTRRERERRTGGQGPSEYRICWPNVRDIAIEQGLQLCLPLENQDEAGQEACAGSMTESENGPPELPSGSSQTACGQAPGQSGQALRERAGARSPSLPSNSSLPLLPPERGREEGGEEVEIWNSLNRRLAAYGVSSTRLPLAEALANGWTAEQIAEFLGFCERQAVGPVKAYGPGAVWTHLRIAHPGAPLTLPPSEAYVRAKRDREIARQEAKRTEDAKPPRTPEQHARHLAWTAEAKRIFAGEMTAEERDDRLAELRAKYPELEEP